MSCLPTDALSHFEQREQELLALNQDLDQKRAKAIAEASGAVQQAETAANLPASSSSVGVFPVSPAASAMMEAVSASVPDVGYALAPVAPEESSRASALVAEAMRRPLDTDDDGSNEHLHETIRSQHLRIVAMQEELSKTIAELAARNNEVHDLRQEAKQATAEQQRLQKLLANGEKTQEHEKRKSTEIDRKHQEALRELSEFAKERDQLDVQKRKLEAEVVSKDARINRLSEECDRYKTAAKDIGSQDRDRAVSDRREMDRLQSEVRKLERQRAELVNAFKKQMKLIDVLKRQRAHVEAARVLSFTEDEFIRILELGDKLGE